MFPCDTCIYNDFLSNKVKTNTPDYVGKRCCNKGCILYKCPIDGLRKLPLTKCKHQKEVKIEVIEIHKFAAPDDVADLDFPNSEAQHEEDNHRFF